MMAAGDFRCLEGVPSLAEEIDKLLSDDNAMCRC